MPKKIHMKQCDAGAGFLELYRNIADESADLRPKTR